MPGALIALLLAGVATPAHAGPEQELTAAQREKLGEVRRLTVDLDRLAQKLSWDGVERVYAKLVALQVPLTTHIHYTAALSAQANGDVATSWRRLERALREIPAVKEKPSGGIDYRKTLPERVQEFDGDGAAARGALDRLKSAYGTVDIQVDAKRLPALIRLGAKPFTQTEREAIKAAQSAVSADFAYEGPLPVGRYMVDGQMFEVTNTEPVEVKVGL